MSVPRIGIIGMGWVGSSVAMSTLSAGIAGELLVHDARAAVAEGEAMDLAHGAAFYPSAMVRAATLDAMTDCDAVVVAAGRNGRPGETRLDLLKDNASTIRTIAKSFSAYRGMVIVVTNPVDVLTYAFAQASGLPHERVLGTGTMLDTARLRQLLGQTLSIAPQSIHAHVLGEHGDSEVVAWSNARVAGVPLRSRHGWTREHEEDLARQVRQAAYEIIRRKGATNHAIGLVTAALLRVVLRNERRVLTVSRVQDGAAGFDDVALSLPAVVGSEGAAEIVEPELDAADRAALERSSHVLRDAIGSLATD